MKKEKISFRVIGDSGPLMISWYDGPKGNAVEAKNEIGVRFFSSTGELLAVEFDDVKEEILVRALRLVQLLNKFLNSLIRNGKAFQVFYI